MGVHLMCGDCLELMDGFPAGLIDLVLTDPPYSSGGLFAGDRQRKTSSKYTNTKFNGASRFQDFDGDSMDQRSFTEFMRMVLAKAKRKSKDGAVCAIFIDWRNLPAMADALQMAGWVYRGIVAWDKGKSRAIPNRFRNDCEYIVWGTNGAREAKYAAGAKSYAGCYHIPVVPSSRKHHQTEKPAELLENIMAICPDGGMVCDPFMGSGSTGVACVHTGRNFIGMELDEWYFETAKNRIKEEQEHYEDITERD